MHLTPSQKPISELFPIEGKLNYLIPNYQRGYSWSTENIEELFNDVLNEDEGYYVGNLLVTTENDNGSEELSRKYSVVDGQQRLTTIALFFLAIYENLDQKNTAGLSEDDRGAIYSLKSDIKRKLEILEQTDHRPRLKLLERDAEVFENYLTVIMGGEKDKPKGKYGTRAFAKRYKFITELIDEKFKSYSELKIFYDKLNAVILLRITMSDLVDAFTVFSSLNAKGLPLTLIDLLKSTFMKSAVGSINDKDASELWDQLISIFTNGDSQTKSSAVTQLLLNNYDAFISDTGSSITKTKALKKYQKVFEKRGYEYIHELIKNAQIFSAISPVINTDEDVEFSQDIMDRLNSLMKLDASQVYPLMMFLLKELNDGQIEEVTIISIFDLLIKFYVRRNIVLKPKASNVRSAFLQVVRKIEKRKSDEDINEVALDSTTKTVKEISVGDDEFKSALSDDVYEISPKTVRFILISLERKNGTYFNKQRPDTLDKYTEKNGKKQMPIWSLEHILPESNHLNNDWVKMISPDNTNNANIVQEEWMHKLGNLTLTGYNSEMSDKAFKYKINYKHGNSAVGLATGLFINDSITSSDEKIAQKENWTPEDIKRRTKILTNLIIEDFSLK